MSLPYLPYSFYRALFRGCKFVEEQKSPHELNEKGVAILKP